jgi:hypothetical protein
MQQGYNQGGVSFDPEAVSAQEGDAYQDFMEQAYADPGYAGYIPEGYGGMEQMQYGSPWSSGDLSTLEPTRGAPPGAYFYDSSDVTGMERVAQYGGRGYEPIPEPAIAPQQEQAGATVADRQADVPQGQSGDFNIWDPNLVEAMENPPGPVSEDGDAPVTQAPTADSPAVETGDAAAPQWDGEGDVPVGDDGLYAANDRHSRYADDIDWRDYGFNDQAAGDRWAEQFAAEHGGALPWDSQGQGSNKDPRALLNEHVAAMQWGGQFQQDFGRAPEESEYQMEWYRSRFGDPNRELTWRPGYDLQSNRWVPQTHFGMEWSDLSNKHWQPFGTPDAGPQVGFGGGGGGNWRQNAINRYNTPWMGRGI